MRNNSSNSVPWNFEPQYKKKVTRLFAIDIICLAFFICLHVIANVLTNLFVLSNILFSDFSVAHNRYRRIIIYVYIIISVPELTHTVQLQAWINLQVCGP